jgi:hypothetical protein
LPGERILPKVGSADDLERARTESPIQSFASDLNMNVF